MKKQKRGKKKMKRNLVAMHSWGKNRGTKHRNKKKYNRKRMNRDMP